jgi:tetratricopeptide (TPR) repeat protein
VRGDLDWIVMKTLEKDRARRYPTANGLALDVQRYLAGEVISARPPSALYKFRKLVFRNKILFSGIGLVFLLLLALLTVTGRLLVRERQARQEMEVSRLEYLANALAVENKLPEAKRAYMQAQVIRRKLPGSKPPTPEALNYPLINLIAQDNLVDALALLNEVLTPAIVSQPEYSDLRTMRAAVRARAGQWTEAAAEAALLLERQPENPYRYHMLAPLLVASTNLQGYLQLCPRIVAHFSGTTNLEVADQMAKDCLILSSSGVNLEPVAAMAEFAVANGKTSGAYPFFQCCKALAEYRQGHFEGAVKWAEQAARNSFPYSQAEAYAILAMAQYQSKQVENPRPALAKCDKVVADRLPKLGGRDLSNDWRDWIIAHALLTEARSLIDAERDPKTDGN